MRLAGSWHLLDDGGQTIQTNFCKYPSALKNKGQPRSGETGMFFMPPPEGPRPGGWPAGGVMTPSEGPLQRSNTAESNKAKTRPKVSWEAMPLANGRKCRNQPNLACLQTDTDTQMSAPLRMAPMAANYNSGKPCGEQREARSERGSSRSAKCSSSPAGAIMSAIPGSSFRKAAKKHAESALVKPFGSISSYNCPGPVPNPISSIDSILPRVP